MVPLPEASSWAELNAYFLDCCEREKQHRRHGQTQTICERWTEDRERLLPLPARRFEACVQTVSHVNKERMVAFDGNVYSIPLNPGNPRRNVVVKAFVHRVVISYQDQEVAEHPRCYGKGQQILNPLHYLDLLEQRPRAFEHAKPVRRWRDQWPPVYERYLAKLRERLDETAAVRRFVQVLRLHDEFAAAAIECAVQQALDIECFSADGVRHLLLVQIDPIPEPVTLDLSQRPELQQTPVLAPNLARYNQLLVQEA
jgi:hypothetical protein